MDIALIGVGQAGGRLVDSFLDVDDWLVDDPIVGACAIDTSRAYLEDLSAVPETQRQLIGTDRAKGHGVGADNELAATIAKDERTTILNAIDSLSIGESDAILTVAGLGGGTGSGATPTIAEALRETYDIPVYGLGILPHTAESLIRTLNAARSLRSFRHSTDHVFLFDNDAWIETAPDEEIYQDVNELLATAIGTLFGVLDRVQTDRLGESDRTATEYIETVLSSNELSSIGFAGETIQQSDDHGGLLTRLWPSSGKQDDPTPPERSDHIEEVICEAASPPYTVPVEAPEETDTGLIMVAPESYVSETPLTPQSLSMIDRLDPTHIHLSEPPTSGDADGIAALCILTSDSFDRVTQLTEQAIDLQEDPSQIDYQDIDQAPDIVNAPETDGTESNGQDDLQPLF